MIDPLDGLVEVREFKTHFAAEAAAASLIGAGVKAMVSYDPLLDFSPLPPAIPGYRLLVANDDAVDAREFLKAADSGEFAI